MYSRHIIGGEIYYTCLGVQNGSMEIKATMKIYRDCGALDAAGFDNPAIIGIYTINPANQYSFYVRESWPLISMKTLTSYNPCVVTPPNICVEEGIYEKTFKLPLSNNSYFMAYQRCCRNQSITNIITPGDFGAAYTLLITPEAQRSCDNSPRFNNFPPILICNNKPLLFDHSVNDIEGDSVVYEFCSPYHAGGKRGSNELPGAPDACDGVTPNPSFCLPPFGSVIFKAPFYSFQRPMGGNPIITIDSQTGLISGTPINLGQFVVGVCVKEFRNGNLLTITQRDFQFNVIECQKNLSAGIISDSIQAGDQYIVNACGDKTVVLKNTSTLESNIRTYDWIFDINGTQQQYKTKDLSLTLPDLGTYTGYLYLNLGDKDCSDTAQITINVFPGITADFLYQYDTCISGPTSFTDLSTASLSNIIQWEYEMEPGKKINTKNPIYEFLTPGPKSVNLKITDNNGCTSLIQKQFNYYPVPALLILNPSSFDGCQPLEVYFDNLSHPIDSNYMINWDFGDGTNSKSISPRHTYINPGNYSVKVDITSPIGCKTAASFNNWITARESPVAGFDFNPKKLSNLVNKIDISDQSKNSERIYYTINDKITLNDRNPKFVFADTGVHKITQIVSRLNGCVDTLIQYLDIEPIVTYYLPNAFTPNSNGPNETFFGVGKGEFMTDFEMSIWDRWGSLIYKTEDPLKGWNGRYNNDGEALPPGVYIYQVSYSAPRSKKVKLKGYATLIR